MRYNRKEAFRYIFDEPLTASFAIIEINGKTVETSEGNAQVIDLSLNGLKMKTNLNIPVSPQNQVKIQVHFKINESAYSVNGEIVWRKQLVDSFNYGMKFVSDENVRKELINELKLYARTTHAHS